MTDKTLDHLRKQLDGLDRDLVHLLDERFRIVKLIARIKQELGEPVYQPTREARHLESLLKESTKNICDAHLQAIFEAVYRASRDWEQSVMLDTAKQTQAKGKTTVPIRSVTVVGLGLIGGSIIKSLKAHSPKTLLFGVDHDENSLHKASDYLHAWSKNTEDLIGKSKIWILALPVSGILEWLDTFGPRMNKVMIMDTGSVKTPIMDLARKRIYSSSAFIGGHPLAGSERSGFDASDAQLFTGKTFFLCIDSNVPIRYRRQAQTLVRILGGVPYAIDATLHDRTLTLTSHLPQVLVTTLTVFLSLQNENFKHPITRFLGPAMNDVLRLAASSFTIWRDILAFNPYFDEARKRFLEMFAQPQTASDWEIYFRTAQQFHRGDSVHER